MEFKMISAENGLNVLPDMLPARMLNQYVYCPRLFYLEWVNHQWAESGDTEEGHFVHRNVDKISGDMPEPDDLDNPFVSATSVKLSSDTLGFVAVADIIEGREGEVHPVDYKKGETPDTEDGLNKTDKIQLAIACLLLRETGYICNSGSVYYAASRQKIEFSFTEELLSEALEYAEEAKKAAEKPEAPPPLVASRKCPRCSMVGICLPDETNLLTEKSQKPPREMRARNKAARPVYVTVQGSSIGIRNNRLYISYEGKNLQEVLLINISQVCIFGNAQISSQCIRELMSRDVYICWFSFGGWFSGMATGLPSKNVNLRIRQSASAASGRFDIAKSMIKSKIWNQRVLLRRNAKPEEDGSTTQKNKTLTDMKYMIGKIDTTENMSELMGIEGNAARAYFQSFSLMLLQHHRLPGSPFIFENRNRRPPLDPINCLLSYLYAVLVKDITVTLHSVGFDPYLGIMHKPRFGRPALALDLAEEFRPLIADSVVISLINNNEIKPHDFIVRAQGIILTDKARKKVLGGYEKRLAQEIQHPIFGYTVSYRRVFELQARLLAATMIGEIPEYTPIQTR